MPRRHGAGLTPEERLLAIFDVFDDWFHRDDFEACSFINVLLETADSSTRSARRSVVTSRTSARSSAGSPTRPGSATPTGSPASGTS